jgi:hypothetical protein
MAKEDLKVLREKFLSDCPPDKSFWTCNGTVVRNIYELKNTINALNDLAFRYHVNNDNHKNDFAAWIHDVIEDNELAKRLRDILDKGKYVAVIEKRIKQLESA